VESRLETKICKNLRNTKNPTTYKSKKSRLRKIKITILMLKCQISLENDKRIMYNTSILVAFNYL
jgi:hypothetical protein